MPPKVTPGSITKTADVQKDRIGNISNVSRAISQMQKDVDQKIAETQKEVKDNKAASQVHHSMNQTLSGLNKTINALTAGVSKITSDTARATSDAVRQYGQAISQDISFNKKSVVAMALSQTSPLYGYFVSKFMETDVFKRALTRMKTQISQTIGAIVRPLKGKGAVKGGAEIPHMQTGGKVQQGGMARLHAGETVVPSGGGIDMSGVQGILQQMLNIQKRQDIYMRSVFGVMREPEIAGIFKKLGRGALTVLRIPRKVVSLFRKTKGRYEAQLSKEDMPLENIAQNLATLFTGSMWRFDNMISLLVANVEATRDLSAYVTGTRYSPVEGVSSRIPKMAGLRTALKWMTKPISGPMAWMMEPLFKEGGKTKEALYKKRGFYKDEPGFGETIRRAIGIPGPEELLGKGQFGSFYAGGGEFAPGEGIGNVIGFTEEKMRQLSEVQSDTWGGSYGRKQPIWVISQYTSDQATSIANRDAWLESIKESSEEQVDIAEKARKEAKKRSWWRMIFGWFKMIPQLLGSLIRGAGLGIIVAGLGYWVGTKIKDWLDKEFNFSENIQKFFDSQLTITNHLLKQFGQESVSAKKQMGMMKAGDILPEQAHWQVQRSKRLQLGDVSGLKRHMGGIRWGLYGESVQAGMQDYVRNNIGSYINYDQGDISRLRAKWLSKGGQGFHWLRDTAKMAGSPTTWGKELEEMFHTHMLKELTPINDPLAAPSSYHKTYEKAIKAKGLDPKAEAALRQQQREAYERSTRQKIAPSPEEMKKISLAKTKDFISKAYEISPTAAEARMKELINIVGKDSPILYNHPAMVDIIKSGMEYRGDSWFYSRTKFKETMKAKAEQYKDLESPTKDAMGGSIKETTIASNEVDLQAKTVKIAGVEIANEIEDFKLQQKKLAEKQVQATLITGDNLSNTYMQTSNNSTSISGGGGGSNLDSNDEYSLRTYYGGR